MFLIHIFSRIKCFFFTVFGVVRRAFCCFSRQRKPSYAECEVLTSVNVQSNNYSNTNRNEAERDWNSWDDSPRTVDEHIEHYRQRLAQPKQNDDDEPAMDFFQGMVPKVKKQKKMYVDTGNNTGDNFSRLQATGAASIPHIQTAELEDWSDNEQDENGPAGWEEIDDENTRQMIREKKREIRAQKQQQKIQRLKQQQQQHHHLQRN